MVKTRRRATTQSAEPQRTQQSTTAGHLNVSGAARYLNVSVSLLNTLRSVGGGPVYIKLRSRVFYTQSDLDAWVVAQRRRSTAEHRPAA